MGSGSRSSQVLRGAIVADAVGHWGIFVHNSSDQVNPRVTVRQSPTDANRLFLDFDPAAPGGRGGASVRLDPGQGLASLDGVHKNVRLPPRSTGGLLAEGLQQSGMPRPAILEGFNVERSTAAALAAGGNGQGTLLGNMLEDAARALGGTVTRWEPNQGRHYLASACSPLLPLIQKA
jgi:hypothetical protein